MLYFRKLFKLPGPKELGKSNDNFLPSREWTPEATGYCWEDWYEEVKRLYPIRYFFAETFPTFIRNKIWFPIIQPIDKIFYWFKSHFIPNSRYHILDLRQKCQDENNIDYYRYGWIDADRKMLFAIFNILDQFMEKEFNNLFFPTEEDIEKDSSLIGQRDFLLEMKSIHHWWNHERKLEYQVCNDNLTAWHNAKRNKLPQTKELWEKLQQSDLDFELKTDKMIARLMKIRRNLWS